MAALAAQISPNQQIIHPRGGPISVVYTCPGCGIVIFAKRLNRRNGVHSCAECKTCVLFGLCLYLLPLGPTGAHYIVPDQSLPPKERTRNGVRTRSRKSRMAYLASLGLGDPMPQIALQAYQEGVPVNRVVRVSEPDAIV